MMYILHKINQKSREIFLIIIVREYLLIITLGLL